MATCIFCGATEDTTTSTAVNAKVCDSCVVPIPSSSDYAITTRAIVFVLIQMMATKNSYRWQLLKTLLTNASLVDSSAWTTFKGAICCADKAIEDIDDYFGI